MFRYAGGQTVRHGFYWNPGTWAVTLIEREGGTLPGRATDRYLRVPAVVLLALAPIMGAVYVIFLPLVGFALVLDFAARRAGRLAGKAVWRFLATVVPAWRPGTAYLADRDRDARKAEPPAKDETPRGEA